MDIATPIITAYDPRSASFEREWVEMMQEIRSWCSDKFVVVQAGLDIFAEHIHHVPVGVGEVRVLTETMTLEQALLSAQLRQSLQHNTALEVDIQEVVPDTAEQASEETDRAIT